MTGRWEDEDEDEEESIDGPKFQPNREESELNLGDPSKDSKLRVAALVLGEPDALLTESDLRECAKMSAYFAGGWLIGKGIRRGVKRRLKDYDGRVPVVGAIR